ncbi:MAG: hypothetical protein Q8M76_01420, partial [Spirochaetaceae bacterium]|nr:hypothetical protein [Spirochaetaceae bacterium]
AGRAEGWEFFGSQTVMASLALEKSRETGFSSETRFGLERSPEFGPAFRAEGALSWGSGRDSRAALAFDAGLAPVPSEASLPPGTDLHTELSLNQAWASFALGALDAKFGLVPISWGAGYAFNPLALTSPPEFPGAGTDRAEGRFGFTASLSILGFLSLEAYALAEPRLRSPTPSLEEVAAGNVPFGVRTAARLDGVDFSLAFGRFRMSTASDPQWFAGMDATGFLGPVTWYAETAARLLAKNGSAYRPLEPSDDIDACAGFSCLVPVAETTLRVEGAWLGGGSDDSALYDRAGMIAGTRAVLGKAYLLAMAEKELDDRFKASASVLWNLFDRSAGWLAEASWSPIPSLEFIAACALFSGDGASEFGGTLSTGPESRWDPFGPSVAIRAKASF